MPEELTASAPAAPDAAEQEPSPAPPLVPSQRRPDRPLRRRPLVLALLVLVAGAALGAGGYTLEQRYYVWRPRVTETAGGWRITGGQGSHPVGPVISARRMAWGQNLFTCVIDLASGDEKTIGFASPHTSIWPPAINDRYVAWMESPRTKGRRAIAWVYDTRSGRRVGYVAPADSGPAVLTDSMVVWYQGGSPARIVGVDLVSGRRSTLSDSSEPASNTVVASGSSVGWLLAPAGGSLVAELKDVVKGGTVRVPLIPAGGGSSVGDIQFSGGHLLWTLEGGGSNSMQDYDVETGRTTTVARGDVRSPATDGRTIVWATASVIGPGSTIMGVRTAGGQPFIVTRLAGWPDDGLAVGGDWVAWTAQGGSSEYLQAGRLPR